MSLCIHSVVNVAAAEQGIVFAMGNDYFPEGLCFKHCPSHKFLALNSSAVIGKGYCIFRQFAHRGKFLALLPHRYCGIGINIYCCALLYYIRLLFKMRHAVGNGIQVGHCQNRGVATVGGRPATRFNGFFIRKTRLTKMHMHIAKAGKKEIFFAVKNRNSGKRRHQSRNIGKEGGRTDLFSCSVIYCFCL